MNKISKFQTYKSGGLYCLLDYGMPVFNNEKVSGKENVGMKSGSLSLEMNPKISADGYVDVECRYATEEEFELNYLSENDRGDLYLRYGKAKLQVNMITKEYELDSPAGIPVGWRHNLDYMNPVGRVLTMGVAGTNLVGTARLSKAEIQNVMPGGIQDVSRGMNTGLSIGFHFDEPEIEVGEGTLESPDLITFKNVSVYEASMTPMPRLRSAGILNMNIEESS